MDEQRQDNQLEPIYSSSVPIQVAALKTYWERWTIETDGEWGSGRYVQAVRHDDDDDDDWISLINSPSSSFFLLHYYFLFFRLISLSLCVCFFFIFFFLFDLIFLCFLLPRVNFLFLCFVYSLYLKWLQSIDVSVFSTHKPDRCHHFVDKQYQSIYK